MEFTREEKIEKLKRTITDCNLSISKNEVILNYMQMGDIVNGKDYWEYADEIKTDKLQCQMAELLLKKLEKGEAK